MNTEKQCPQWALTYALQFFTPLELSTLNCGDYHDTYHSFYVAEAVFEMALQLDRCPRRAADRLLERRLPGVYITQRN